MKTRLSVVVIRSVVVSRDLSVVTDVLLRAVLDGESGEDD